MAAKKPPPKKPAAKGKPIVGPIKKGALHKQLGIASSKKIPPAQLAIQPGDSAQTRKRKQFAINAKKWRK